MQPVDKVGVWQKPVLGISNRKHIRVMWKFPQKILEKISGPIQSRK